MASCEECSDAAVMVESVCGWACIMAENGIYGMVYMASTRCLLELQFLKHSVILAYST